MACAMDYTHSYRHELRMVALRVKLPHGVSRHGSNHVQSANRHAVGVARAAGQGVEIRVAEPLRRTLYAKRR